MASEQMIKDFWAPFGDSFCTSLSTLFRRADLFGIDLNELRSMHEERMERLIASVKESHAEELARMQLQKSSPRPGVKALMAMDKVPQSGGGMVTRCEQCQGPAVQVEVNTNAANQTGDGSKWAIVCFNRKKCGFTKYI